MPNRIEKLIINSFKGASCIVDIAFDTKKPAVLIFGENGTGKSTIIDALDFVCNESIGSMDDRSMPGNASQYLPTIGKSYNDINLELVYKGNHFKGHIGAGNVPHTTPKDDLPTLWVLRRSKILELVVGRPADRYKAMKMFIEVPQCEKVETALRDAIKTKKSEYDTAMKLITESKDQLQHLWELEGQSGDDPLTWAREHADINKNEIENEVKRLGEFLTSHQSTVKKESDLLAIKQSLDEKKTNLDLANGEFEKLKNQTVINADELVNILVHSQKYLHNNISVENCPVCLKKIDDVPGLNQNINLRLQELNAVKIVMLNKREAEKDLEKIQHSYCLKQNEYINSVGNLARIISNSDIKEVKDIIENWEEFECLLDEKKVLVAEDFPACKRLIEMINLKSDSIKENYDSKNKALEQINACKVNLETLDKRTSEAEHLELLVKKLKDLHPIFETERKKYVEEILDRIASTIDDMYCKVHPDEGLGNIKFSMKKSGQGSVEYTGKFQDKEVPPQAYFSESHLDTLGVCIFLALAKHYNDENTIIALDDVITSVDQTHMTRLMNMLHDEAEYFNQIFITTHYRPWKNKYKYAKGPVGNVQLIELLHWSMPRGVRPTKSKLCIDEIQENLMNGSFDRQIVASKSGIFLEAILDEITYRYECKLPRKSEPGYQLGELFDSLSKKLKSQLYITKTYDNDNPREILLEPYINQLHEMSWIRNQVGCHFNVYGDNISDEEVKEFGQKTIEFAKVITCDECGEIPSRKKSGSYFECKCSKTRMNPLEIPK